ncbi:protein kinase [Actinomadura sp. 9N215]|uniref:protein kinase domain-containing protein n=1 Tax=Actinomadura sp. 9N215 TaxID=3375150 RepID=UPI0037913779
MRAGEATLPQLGDAALIGELRSRIRHSRGGAFLITGFRGVGKSTLVLRALDEIVEQSAPDELVLAVTLSVARSTTTERLLFAVVRRVFEALSDSGVLDRLPMETRRPLLLAYMRTSLAFKETQSEARERGATLDVGAGGGRGVKTVVDYVVPKLNLSAKRTSTMASEAAFLAYSETDVEHDLMRIVSLLDNEAELAPEPRSGIRRLWPWPRQVSSRLRLVIVLDEVDKLTVDAEGLATVETLLSGIKNVLTMPGAHFLVVAGPDLHDRAVRDAARGNGVYESVFGWRIYVPCTWDAPNVLIDSLIDPDTRPAPDSGQLELLAHYLRFKARGVPRRLLQEFNGFVVWEDDVPHLRVDDTEMERVEFYAQLEDVLRDYIEGGRHHRLFPVAIDEDRWRLGSYFVLDWVLQSDGEPFSATDLLKEGDEAEFDPLLRLSRRNVERLLDHLAQRGILEVIREPGAAATMIGDVAESGAKVFRLAEDVRRSLQGFAALYESERPDGGYAHILAALTSSRGETLPTSGRPPRALGRRYELLDMIGQGGMGTVYRGRDRMLARPVAIKTLRGSMKDDPIAVARLEREAKITGRLRHPQIVRVHDVLHEPDTGPAIVLELLEGPTLDELVQESGPLPPAQVAVIAHRLAGALDYIAQEHIVRLDLKPANVILSAERGPVIIDLGVARIEGMERLTATGLIVGTPGFLAPEEIDDREPDHRVDQYALGLVLYYALIGRQAYDQTSFESIFYAKLNSEVDLSEAPVSAEFREVLARAVARNPESRFPTSGDLQRAIESVPEWLNVADSGVFTTQIVPAWTQIGARSHLADSTDRVHRPRTPPRNSTG